MSLKRRDFIKMIGLALSSPAFSWQTANPSEKLEAFIAAQMEEGPIPGLAVAVLNGGRLDWAKGYGFADLEKKIPMTPDTIINIGSVSKTITATAVMQLWETGRFKLDDDINDYLDFDVRNPRFPDSPITFRQLLTHRSSIKDGKAYGDSYSCGDPGIDLKDWIQGYLTPGGKFYDPEDNFHTWKPGQEGELPAEPRSYSNIGYGLLGYLVEAISGEPFSSHTQERIFQPLRMTESAWFLADIDIAKHAVPYTYIKGGEPQGELIPPGGSSKGTDIEEGFAANCLYSFPNYPDGLLRTSAHQLSRFLDAQINEGVYQGKRILKEETVRLMLSPEHFGSALCWTYAKMKDGKEIWLHTGGDPGINSLMVFCPKDKTGLILLLNTFTPQLGALGLGILNQLIF
jgi:CubicO group peptidase (beta-lactamase class C family)